MRWTIKEMNKTSAIDFAIAVLEERRNGTSNSYSPLNLKIDETIKELEYIRNERNKCGKIN